MKIMLATPPMKERRTDIQYIPLGLAYISSVLYQANHEVEILDVRMEKINNTNILRRVEKFKPDIFGVTSATCQIYDAINLISLIKKNFPKVITILGGPHISAVPLQTMSEFSSIDIGIIGEGELTIVELLNSINDEYKMKEVNGIIFRSSVNGEIILNNPRDFIKNTDKIQFPIREIFPLKIYNRNVIEYKAKPITSIITSRGCPFGCIFCCKSTFGSKYRIRSVDNVLKELQFLIEEKGYREIHIVDDNFTLNINRAKEICKEIIKRKWNVNFALPNGIRAETFNEEMAFLMKKSGFYYVWFGVESGDPEVLKSIKKNIKIEQIIHAVQLAKKFNFFVGMYFVVGLPGSSYNSELMSLDLAKKLEPDVIGVSIFTAYPGSPVYDHSLHHGWHYYRHDFAEHHFTGKNFDEKYILAQFDKISQGFYFRPHYYFRLITKHKILGIRRIWINFKNFLLRRLKLNI